MDRVAVDDLHDAADVAAAAGRVLAGVAALQQPARARAAGRRRHREHDEDEAARGHARTP